MKLSLSGSVQVHFYKSVLRVHLSCWHFDTNEDMPFSSGVPYLSSI